MKFDANSPSGRSLFAALTLILPVAGQVPDQLKHSISGPPAGLPRYGYLGYSVAVEGGYTVAGLPYEFTAGKFSGVVKVFDSGSGALLFELPNPHPDANDAFGRLVAISGSRVVVVVSQDDTGVSTPGLVYVYDLASGTPTVPLITLNIPTPTPYDFFGASVAISGTWVVVGTPYDDTSAEGSGSAYCYDLSSATPTVPVLRFHHPEAAEYASFGRSVAISGSRVVVGAPDDNTGAFEAGSAYIYDLAGATPSVPVAALLNPLPAEEDNFLGACHQHAGCTLFRTGILRRRQHGAGSEVGGSA